MSDPITDFRPALAGTTQAQRAALARIKALFERVLERFNVHVKAKGNVHGLTAKDIGLGETPNYAPATKLQAELAKNNTTLMTPKRVDNWAEANLYGPIAQAFNNAADRL